MIIFDLSVEQGSTFTQTLTLNEDLTGYTIASNAKDSIGVITDNIATITTVDTGIISVEISAGNTASMSVGVGYYDIELTDTATGRVSKPIKGRVYVSGEVTV